MFAGKAELEYVIEQGPATLRRHAARDADVITCPARIGLGHVPSILHGCVVRSTNTARQNREYFLLISPVQRLCSQTRCMNVCSWNRLALLATRRTSRETGNVIGHTAQAQRSPNTASLPMRSLSTTARAEKQSDEKKSCRGAKNESKKRYMHAPWQIRTVDLWIAQEFILSSHIW